MKKAFAFLSVSLIALACAASFGLSAARADDNEQGGDIEGTESMGTDIPMTPTTAAPAGSSIKLQLEADDEDGTTNATLKLETQGLPAGTYSVNVTLKSDGSSVPLGTFTIGATSTNGDDEGNEDGDDEGNDDGDDNNQGSDDQGDDNGQGEIVFGSEGTPFPANFNPFDIATVSVSDANNVVLFTADLSATSTSSALSMNLSANVQAKGGSGNPAATGTAMLTAVTTNGKTKGSLSLNGRGLLPNTPLSVAVNGAMAKKVNTTKTGSVSVLLKPTGKTAMVAGVSLFKIHSVTLRDKFGNVVLSANF